MHMKRHTFIQILTLSANSVYMLTSTLKCNDAFIVIFSFGNLLPSNFIGFSFVFLMCLLLGQLKNASLGIPEQGHLMPNCEISTCILVGADLQSLPIQELLDIFLKSDMS